MEATTLDEGAGYLALTTGLKNVLDPQVADIQVWDWAWGLSHTARWSGATPVFWSVLSHTGLVLMLAKRELGSNLNPVDELGILLHDASEAMGFGDLPNPIKRSPEFSFYREAEDRMMDTIFARFGLTRDVFNWDVIHRYDMQAMYVEWQRFFGHFRGHRCEARPVYPIDLKALGALVVAKPLDYVEHLRHLTINLAETYDIKDINDLFMMPETLLAYTRPEVDPLEEPVINADILQKRVDG